MVVENGEEVVGQGLRRGVYIYPPPLVTQNHFHHLHLITSQQHVQTHWLCLLPPLVYTASSK